jgi:hypothetical protein
MNDQMAATSNQPLYARAREEKSMKVSPEPSPPSSPSSWVEPDGSMADEIELIRRQPEPPEGFDWFEGVIMASAMSPTVVIDRVFSRALLRYVRRLERDVAEWGFW